MLGGLLCHSQSHSLGTRALTKPVALSHYKLAVTAPTVLEFQGLVFNVASGAVISSRAYTTGTVTP